MMDSSSTPSQIWSTQTAPGQTLPGGECSGGKEEGEASLRALGPGPTTDRVPGQSTHVSCLRVQAE